MIKAYKHIGETPLDVLNRVRQGNLELKTIKLAYAGRLDPMAEGEMLVLVGDECNDRKRYERLDKEYEFEILFGVSTDSYDVLGKITEIDLKDPDIDQLRRILPRIIGKQKQKYPPYSSPRIKGKSLWWWAREGRLSEISIPEKEIEIYSLDLLTVETKSVEEIYNSIVEKIRKVKGEFRQEEILQDWKKFSDRYNNKRLTVALLRVYCSSGTYIRQLVNNLGFNLKIPTVAYSINRTNIKLFMD